MYGVFGGYTRWAVVFLIIFVLFFLFVPGAGAYGSGVAVTTYPGYVGGYHHVGWHDDGYSGYSGYGEYGGYGYESSSP
jgi:hypothetical protein